MPTRSGERLATESGEAVVEWIVADPQPQRVYNIEVETDHRYLVTGVHLLVHNASRLGNKWTAKSIQDPAYRSGCERIACEIQSHIGGEIKTITPPEGVPYLGAYRGYEPVWGYHEVVVKNGRVYDAFTGFKGETIAEFKSQWQFADIINFGF